MSAFKTELAKRMAEVHRRRAGMCAGAADNLKQHLARDLIPPPPGREEEWRLERAELAEIARHVAEVEETEQRLLAAARVGAGGTQELLRAAAAYAAAFKKLSSPEQRVRRSEIREALGAGAIGELDARPKNGRA